MKSFQDAIEDIEGCDDEKGGDFEDLPIELQSWIQSQDGLKIHGKPVTNRKDLELVFVLLDIGRRYSKHFSTEDLARMVGHLFLRKIQKNQSDLKRDEAIPGKPGQVIYRKCYACERPILDDAFPLFCAKAPDHYFIDVARSHSIGGNGCGQQGCNGKPGLVPSDDKQPYLRMETSAINAAMNRLLEPNWKDSFCRTGTDLQGCATSVQVRCCGTGKDADKVNCGIPRDYKTPAWTIHKPPRLVQPRLKCECDEKTKDHFFVPVNEKIPYINPERLRRIDKGFKKAGVNLAAYPKIPELIFNIWPDGSDKKTNRPYADRLIDLREAKKDLEAQTGQTGHTG